MFKAMINWLRMLRQSPLNMMESNRGIVGFNVMTLKKQRPDWYHADLAALTHLLAEGSIQPLIAERLSLTEASRAHRLLGQNAVQGKLVLICHPV
jgi:NADPH2:quinone reductase